MSINPPEARESAPRSIIILSDEHIVIILLDPRLISALVETRSSFLNILDPVQDARKFQ
jgi:hypothetical protein